MAKIRNLKEVGTVTIHGASDFSLVATYAEACDVAQAHGFPKVPITIRPAIEHPKHDHTYMVSGDRCVIREVEVFEEIFQILIGARSNTTYVTESGISLFTTSDLPLVAIKSWPGR